MSSRPNPGKGSARSSEREHDAWKRLLLLAIMSVVLTAVASSVVDAAAMDSVRSAWGSMRVYILTGAFWVNALIVFAGIFLLYTLLLSSKVGSNNTQQVMMYIVIGVVAIIIATKFVDQQTGAPQYLWQNQQFRQFTQFMIGPAQPLGTCAAPTHSFWRAIMPFGLGEPNPPCCGAGAYFINAHGRTNVCKQAILRTNENGSGLPAFIIASILFYLLLAAYSKNLGFDSAGSGGAKWFPIVLAVLLGALMANERITKNHILIIGGWVALILLGNKLSKTLGGEGGDKDKKGSKRGFGFGLAYAFIQLILNMLGTSLWGGSVDASEVTTGSILFNIITGLIIGVIYGAFVGEGIFGKMMDKMKKKQQEEVEKQLDDGNYLKAMLRGLPGIGRMKWLKPEASHKKKLSKQLNDKLKDIWKDYADELVKDTPDSAKLDSLKDRINYTIDVIEKIKEMPEK